MNENNGKALKPPFPYKRNCFFSCVLLDYCYSTISLTSNCNFRILKREERRGPTKRILSYLIFYLTTLNAWEAPVETILTT